jgi:hypothetical protein
MIRFASACFAAAFLVSAAPAASPYHLVATTMLPAMPEGDFDQLVADVPHNRLYVSAEGGAAMDVFDLRTGALVRSGGPVASPHKVALDADHKRLLIADGGDGSVKVLTPDLALVARIAVGPKADSGVLDRARHIFYVGRRAPDATETTSIITAISTDSLNAVATYRLPATTVKGMILDARGRRLLVSLRDRNAIGVVHLDTAKVELWTPPGLHRSVPLALDLTNHAVYAGSRGPGELDVLDAGDGHLRAALPSTETSDSISFDRANNLLYLSGDSGMSRYRIGKDGSVRLLETTPELVGKTSLYVPELRRLYVMRPKKGAVVAALTVFEIAK